jgi:hypothetical protein
MPATASGMINDGAPMLLNLREQIVNATSEIAPSPYSLQDGVSFTTFPCATVPTASAKPRFVAP